MRYKIRILGIPFDGTFNALYDNEFVYNKASFADKQPKKKY